MTIYLDHDSRRHGLGKKLYEAMEKKLRQMV
ncbi:MAG: GNAT family N-acetyltransferase [Candidatus Weimeria sp.]